MMLRIIESMRQLSQPESIMRHFLLALILLLSQTYVLAAHTQEVGLTEAQLKAVLEALNGAIRETGADPTEIIRLGLEKFKENQQKSIVATTTEPPKVVDAHKETEGDSPRKPSDDDDGDFGLKSLFGHEQKEDARDDHFGLKSLPDEHNDGGKVRTSDRGPSKIESALDSSADGSNKPSVSDPHQAKSTENSSSKANVFDRDSDFGLKALFNDDEASEEAPNATKPKEVDTNRVATARDAKKNSPEATKNPMDEETDFGLQTLFGEPKQVKSTEKPAPAQGNGLESRSAKISLSGKSSSSNPVSWNADTDQPARDKQENLHDPQSSTVWPEDDQGEPIPDTAPEQHPVSLDFEKPGGVNILPTKEHREEKDSSERAQKYRQAEERAEPGQDHRQTGKDTKPTGEFANPTSDGKREPIEEHFVDSYIDDVDPNDPKKVHIEPQIQSKLDPTGAVSHVHAETRTSSSLIGNKSHHSGRSSHSSTSQTSSSNGRPRRKIWNKRKNHGPMKMPAFPVMPQAPIAPLAPVVFMPMVPYGAQSAWSGPYNSNLQLTKKQQRIQQQQFPLTGAFASASAGFPGGPTAFVGAASPYYRPTGFPDPAKIAQRRAKNARRRANKARREQIAASQK